MSLITGDILGLLLDLDLSQNPVLGWGWLIASMMANLVWAMPQFSLGTAALQQNLGFLLREYGTQLAHKRRTSAAKKAWHRSAECYSLASLVVVETEGGRFRFVDTAQEAWAAIAPD